jgi:hypothetical protein
MLSFETLDSDHKARLGCRGVGRLLWLKAFGFDRLLNAARERNRAFFDRLGLPTC